jgi:hypothetical protein
MAIFQKTMFLIFFILLLCVSLYSAYGQNLYIAPSFTNPAGSEEWIPGFPVTIKWKPGTGTDSIWGLVLFRANPSQQVGIINRNIPSNQTSYQWKVGDTLSSTATPGLDYYLRLYFEKDGTRRWIRSETFKIRLLDSRSPRILVTYPNKNSQLDAGGDGGIKWTTKHLDISTSMHISLWSGKGIKALRSIGKGSNGLFFWNIPDDLGGYYKVRVTKIEKIPVGQGQNKQKQIYGMSERFYIKPKLIEETIQANHRDRHKHKKLNPVVYWKSNSHEGKGFGSKKNRARIGYFDWIIIGNEKHYIGWVFRSRIRFDLSSLKGKWVKKAKLLLTIMERKENKHPKYNSGGKKALLFVLSKEWEPPVHCLDPAPGYGLAKLYMDKSTMVEVTNLVKDWISGKKTNHGLLLVGPKENFLHTWDEDDPALRVSSANQAENGEFYEVIYFHAALEVEYTNPELIER